MRDSTPLVTDHDTGRIGPSVAGCKTWQECREIEAKAVERGQTGKVRRRRVVGQQLDLFAEAQQPQLEF